MSTLVLQKQYHATGATLPLAFRLRQLRVLHRAIREREEEIAAALHADLGKSREEAYLTEIGLALTELRHTIRHLADWARPRRVPTPLVHQPGRSTLLREPYGVCLIIAPWNYPFLLSITPLISAMAGGNCAALKPSELAPRTAAVLERLIRDCFDPRYLRTVLGGAETAAAETRAGYDFIFFTGSERVGRLVLSAAAEHLTPVVLELGGKSPCIVDGSAPLRTAARRIAWGKLLNAGQTCVAPDYLLVHRSVKGPLTEQLRRAAREFYGADPCRNPDCPRIVTPGHFRRLAGLVEELPPARRLIEGGRDPASRRMGLTVLDCGSVSDPFPCRAMEEEIFGPVLPLLTYDSLDEALAFAAARPKPLALYLFSRRKEVQRRVMGRLSFGGGCINDTVSHLATPFLPFGGVGASGMGAYHGRYGFEAFTHPKGVLSRGLVPDLPLRYPPLNGRLPLFRLLLR